MQNILQKKMHYGGLEDLKDGKMSYSFFFL